MAFTDMQGRLLGKRLHRDFFLEQVAHGHGTEGCNYLLAVDMEMDPVPGYEIASWERGYGDFALAADLSTLRRIPWLDATAMVQCDVEWGDGSPVRPSPRQVLRAQIERARGHGFEAMFASELEFYLLRETYAEALRMADNHVVYKNGAKEIAHLNGCSITFMAKPDASWIGSSCHIHSSLWRDGENAFAGESDVFRSYLAGQIACARELAIFFAPNVNSYKRYAAGSWAPTTLAWGRDNRTCGFRVVGTEAALRAETRIPGGDVNPYLAFAALLAAGLHGIENSLELGPALEGNAYDSGAERFPSTLREAIAALEESPMARAAFGDDVVDHYLNYARTEQELFDRVVTDWERARLYERG